MKQILTTDRKVIIHDFDGVHYDYADHPDIYDFLGDVKAQAATALFPALTLAQAKEIGIESYRKHHNGMTGFIPYAKEKGMTVEDMTFELSKEYHRIGYEKTKREFPDFIKSCVQTHDLFSNLKAHGIRHGILTQSDREHWAEPFLRDMGYFDHIEPDAIHGFVESKGQLKSNSPYPLANIMHAMKTQSGEVVFLEDSLPNMDMAKQCYEDILNVYVHHGKPLDVLPTFVDMQVEKPRTLLTQVKSLYTGMAPAITPAPSLNL